MTDSTSSAARAQLGETLSALGHPIRLELLEALAHRDGLDVCTLAAVLGIPVANTSHHLARLRQVGIVRSQRAGTRIVNRVDARLFDALDELTALVNGAGDQPTPE